MTSPRGWHVVQTVAQRERWIGAELHRSLGLHWYVPNERNRIARRQRVIEVLRPLMPGYLFLAGLEDCVWHDVESTRGVIGILRLGQSDAPALVSDDEVSRIRDLEQQHNVALEDRRKVRPLQAGDRVRAKDGPFASIEALIRAVRGKTAIIEVHLFGTMTTARVGVDILERAAP